MRILTSCNWAQHDKILHMLQESSNSQPKENLTYSYPEGILVNNKEPRTFIKGLFSRKNKNSVLIRFRRGQRRCSIASEVKSCWPGTKPTETNKNVRMKQINFTTENKVMRQKYSLPSQNYEPSRVYSTRRRKWLKQATFRHKVRVERAFQSPCSSLNF